MCDTNKFRFTIIGSRSAPTAHCEALIDIGVELMQLGGEGSSGGADGPDNSFTMALQDIVRDTGMDGGLFGRIYLPWNGYNGLKHGDMEGAVVLVNDPVTVELAKTMASIARGSFYGLTEGGIALHTRNAFPILGEDLRTHTDVVIISANTNSRGKVVGGTATAVNIARAIGKPVINLQDPYGFQKVTKLIEYVKDLPSGRVGEFKIPE